MKTGVFPFEQSLREYDVWDFHPMDQGGRLVHLQLVGSEKDVDIVAALKRPDFFAPWGEPIRWDRLETTELEKSVWLNRWYYLPSFARLYHITSDRSYLDDFLRLFRQWTADNPVPDNLSAYFQSRQYIWRDMQVAWRTQHLIWSFFLGHHGCAEAERQELLDSVETHARVLLAYFGSQPHSQGNHQSHGALAMLHVGLLFPELEDATILRTKALEILNYHVENAFFADGNSVELCPGYYPFIAANFRDAYLLCAANAVTLSSLWVSRLTQCYNFMRHVQQPDGTMPPVNDSSEVSVVSSLKILGSVLGIDDARQPTGSVRFDSSHQAVMRDGDGPDADYMFLDAGAAWPYHWHGGKLGFHYWHHGRPCLVDSGVCNYDESLRVAWYLTPQAHNTILVDGFGDADIAQEHSSDATKVGSWLSDWQSTSEYDLATMTDAAFQSLENPVQWTRKILMFKRRFVVLVDQLRSTAEHDYSWLFHFTPTTLQVDSLQKRFVTGFHDRNVLLAPFQPDSLGATEITQHHINKNSRNFVAPVVRFTAHAADVATAFLILPVSGTTFPSVRLEQQTNAAGVTLKIHGEEEVVDISIAFATSDVTVLTQLLHEVTRV